MPYQYTASDTIVDKRTIENLKRLTSLAHLYECEWRVAKDEAAIENNEGYEMLRFVVKALSEEALAAFVKSAIQQTDLHNWFNVSESYFSKAFDFAEDIDISPLSFNSWIDTLVEVADANNKLSQKLQSQQSFCFSYDWMLPASFSECRKWLDVVISASNMMGIGCSIRRGQIKKRKDERYAQRLLLRLFSEDAIEKFTVRAKKLTEVDDWNRVDVEDFLNAQPLYLHRLDDFLAHLETEINWNAKVGKP